MLSEPQSIPVLTVPTFPKDEEPSLQTDDTVHIALYLARELARLPQMREQLESLRHATASLKELWTKRPLTVLSQTGEERKDAGVSLRVTTEAELLSVSSEMELARQVRLASEASRLTSSTLGEYTYAMRDICLSAPFDVANPLPTDRAHVEQTAYIIWALLVTLTAVPLSSSAAQLKTEKWTASTPDIEVLRQGGLLSSFMRSMLGMTKPQDANYYISWEEPFKKLVVYRNKIGYDFTFNTGDPVKTFMNVDMFLRSSSGDLDTFANTLATAQENEELYVNYACIYNTITNENWLNSKLQSRLMKRATQEHGRAAAWRKELEQSSMLQLCSFSTGYEASAINLIITPDKILVPEKVWAASPPRHRAVFFVLCSSRKPYETRQALLVVEPAGTDVTFVGIQPAWFGDAHVDALLSWLQLGYETGFKVWKTLPSDLNDVIANLKAGVLTSDAITTQKITTLRESVAVERKEEEQETKADHDEFISALWPLMGLDVAMETGRVARQQDVALEPFPTVEPSQLKQVREFFSSYVRRLFTSS